MTNNGIQTTATLKPGDTVYIDRSRHGRINVKPGKVLSISPTGVARVDPLNGMAVSFMANGAERGRDWAERAQLITKERYEAQLLVMGQQRRERAANDAIKVVYDIPATTANKTKLTDALRAALTAVEAI